jgi:methane/ammonia monooxygenase subunit C
MARSDQKGGFQMAQAATVGRETVEKRPRRGPIDWWGGWRLCIVGPLGFIALALAIRIWEQSTAWTVGINAASDEFATSFLALFIAEVLAVTIATVLWWGTLVRKGREVVKVEATHEEEVRRIAKFWGLIGTTCVIVYIMGSFWPNMDGSWHQTAVRDTALTPAHIPMFFLFFPLAITFSVGMYLYGRYWLSKVYGAAFGFPWSFFLVIAAAVTEMAQVAMNEWGHSLWITEEIFAVPFHWPFVLYAWLASGIFALWAETIIRLLQIEAEIEQPATAGEEAVA